MYPKPFHHQTPTWGICGRSYCVASLLTGAQAVQATKGNPTTAPPAADTWLRPSPGISAQLM